MTYEYYKNAILAGKGIEDYDKVMFVCAEDREIGTREFVELTMLVRRLLEESECAN